MAKKDVTLRGQTLPANWEAQMKADAAGYKEAEANVGVGQFISTRGGILSYQQTPMPGNKMRCVIVDSILANTFYEGDFDPDSPQSPVCYAFGRKEAELAPHEQSPKPQNDGCAGCPNNKFGSAERGRGKACKNGRRLGIIHVDALKDVDGIRDTPVAFMGVPPTSLPSWATYVKTLEATTGKPPYAVVTEIAIVPDPKAQFKVTFTLVAEIKDKKLMAAVFAKHQEVKETIAFPFQAGDGGDAPKKSPRGGGGGAKKEKKPAPVKPAARPPVRQPTTAGATGGRTKF